jgi:hypothetical protein
MPPDTPFPLTGALPESLAEIRQQINYWSTRQNEGEPGSVWEESVKNRLEALKWKERELMGREGRPQPESTTEGNLVFISCGQYSESEKSLGKKIRDLLEEDTDLEAYFAEKQSSLQGLSTHKMGALNRAVGFIGVLHHRGVVETPTGKITRASVWIEQEIALAAFIEQILGRRIEVQLYVQKGIALEGMRDKLLLNAVQFETNEEVVEHLTKDMGRWKSLRGRGSGAEAAFDSSFDGRCGDALQDVFVRTRPAASGGTLSRSPTYLWAYLSPTVDQAMELDTRVEKALGGAIGGTFPHLEELGQTGAAHTEWVPGSNFSEVALRLKTHDHEKRWRVYSSGAVVFATQVAWTIESLGNRWSLYDVAADLVHLLSAVSAFWEAIDYRGRVKGYVQLNVGGLALHQSHQGLPPLFYDFAAHLVAPFPLDLTALYLPIHPPTRSQSVAKAQFDTPLAADQVRKTVAGLVNQLVRGLGWGANLDKLNRTIAAI